MRFCLIFGAVLWKFLFYVEVLRFYKTKQFVVLTQFWGTCSLRFSVVILCGVYNYVILCGFAVFESPLCPPQGEVPAFIDYRYIKGNHLRYSYTYST